MVIQIFYLFIVRYSNKIFRVSDSQKRNCKHVVGFQQWSINYILELENSRWNRKQVLFSQFIIFILPFENWKIKPFHNVGHHNLGYKILFFSFFLTIKSYFCHYALFHCLEECVFHRTLKRISKVVRYFDVITVVTTTYDVAFAWTFTYTYSIIYPLNH